MAPADETLAVHGQPGMLLSSNRTHKFCRMTLRGLKWCDWCKKFILGFGKHAMQCVSCGYTIHTKCEAKYTSSEDHAKKACKKCGENLGERPSFRFKASKGGTDCLVEVDPNPAVALMNVYGGKGKQEIIACNNVTVEKPANGMRKIVLHKMDGTKTSLSFATRRERDQLAACVAYLSQRVRSPISSVPLRVFMGTWNMGDAPPPPLSSGQRMSDWLHPEEAYDIYCVCVQECEYKPRAGYQSVEEDMLRTLETTLGSGYYRVDKLSMWSIRVFVFAKTEHRDSITQVQVTKEATGIAGVGGNKGGVCVALTIRETRLCFVGCHLAAHQDKIEARNSDHREIIEGCQLGWKDFWLTNQFHHVFWAGDLNYRIDHPRPRVVQLCYQGAEGWSQLYQYDQLQHQLKNESCFIDFNESQPFFQPTYKMAVGENVYPDDNKMRIPSWCDRVLWKSLCNEIVVQEEYTACFDLLTSDHRPVYSVFNIRARNQYIPQSIILALSTPPGRMPAEVLDTPASSHFIIRRLAGHDLEAADPNGYSDPYIQFISPVLQNNYSTKVLSKTLNPAWDDSTVPYLYCNFDDVAYLEDEYLFFSVYDWDLTSGDDPLGQGHISLKGICDKREHNFCVRTLSKGRVAGIITGTIQYVP